MSVAELIVFADTENKIAAISCPGMAEGLLGSIDWNMYRGEDLYAVFGTHLEGQIIEFHNRFFMGQLIEQAAGKILLLSHAGVMKALYEETINKVSEGIQIFDRNGYLLHANPASEGLEGYSIEEFRGKHLLDLYSLSEEFSTTLSVLRTKKPVINRCDRFKARNDKELVTINSGYPLLIGNEIFGAGVFESDLSVINNIRNRSFNLEAFIRNDQSEFESNLASFEWIIHTSSVMAEVIRFAKKIALTQANILITGETGTGKELFAQSIHTYSPRRDKPFIDVNCSAVPSNLIESLFFGTEKGAFTGSLNKKGFFELAEGGTLFLDEINSMGIDMQGKLLRVIQEKRYQRVGGNQYHHCNVRIITACNEDPQALIAQNLIRKDFYYRISALSIHIPPLRERKEDIEALSQRFARKLSREYGRGEVMLSGDVYGVFGRYEWPGNVRELQHVLEHAFHHGGAEGALLTPEDLPDYLKSDNTQRHQVQPPDPVNPATRIPEPFPSSETLEAFMEKSEQAFLRRVLEKHGGNVTQSAKTLGLSRQSLQYRIKKYDL